jgi:hypothetical protein
VAERAGRRRTHVVSSALVLSLAVVLSGCTGTLSALDPGSAPRDAEGRPIAPGPATPSTCVTPLSSGGVPATCVPVHNPPSQRFVEQAIPTLLPTRGYGSIEHVRCTDRMSGSPSESDPAGLYAVSHWTCVGREPEGDQLHEDVVWTPAYGFLDLAAVTRDRSAALTVPKPGDSGLPNPHASEETPQPSPPPSQSLHDAAEH